MNKDFFAQIQFYVEGSRILGAAALARKFGVDRSTITAVVFNKTWREDK